MELIYHPITKRQLAAIDRGSGSYIFSGASGNGRGQAAISLAKKLNCLQGGDDNCAICRNIEATSFPDLIEVTGGDKRLGIEQVQTLQQALSSRPMTEATTRVVVIDSDSGITPEAQNRLLKTLEEPPESTIIIIKATEIDQLLPTIRSRCQIIHFLPARRSDIATLLGTKFSQVSADAVLALNPATVGEAMMLASDDETKKERQSLYDAANNFLSASLYQRLTMLTSPIMADNYQAIIEILAKKVSRSPASLGSIISIEKAQARIRANVGARSVLEAMAIEL
ncbi:MAG TPA: hypothetical protein VLE72_04170 [Candidatus Saccharimonadales bacterium]|nr:hypothetical protein [Candidatus Saccharimonadales bacterium]